MIQTVIQAISILALLGFIALVIICLLYIAKRLFKLRYYDTLTKFVAPLSYELVFTLSFVATLASLFLSEIAKFPPCILCWYQRIAMYPQVPLLYVAIMRKERVLKAYLLVLNAIGGIIALYHYSLHVLPRTTTILLPCAKAYAGVPCDKGYEFFFGFMTFPLMATIVFVLNILLLSLKRVR